MCGSGVSSARAGSTMNCELCSSLIQKELDGEISPAELGRLETHVSGCGDCRSERAAYLAIDQVLGEAPLVRGPAWMADAVMGDVARRRAVRRFVEPLVFGASAGAATVATAFALGRYLSPETRQILSEGISRSFRPVTDLFAPVAESLPVADVGAAGGPGLHGVVWGLAAVAVAVLAIVALRSSRQLICELRETTSA